MVELDIPMDDGSVRCFSAWRCRHDLGFERSIGTVRIEPGLTPADTDREAFAALMQAGSLRLPYGGACGGIDADLRRLSTAELGRLARCFVQSFPDMAATGRSAFSGGLAGTLLSGWVDGGGRSLWLGIEGGTPSRLGREEAIALGAFTQIRRFAGKEGRWALWGCDQSSLLLARRLCALGWELTGVSDRRGAVVNAWGLTPSELACGMANVDGVVSMAGERGSVSADTPLDGGVELVVVAGREGPDAAALGGTGCRMVVELVPGGISRRTEAELAARGIVVLPEIVATSGQSLLTHLGWLRRRWRRDWTDGEMKDRLLQRMHAMAEGDEGPTGRAEATAGALRFIGAAQAAGRSLLAV
ncbi:Glu/Leu/Phe/Val dehydrogenase dimerization domain-containing protein [Magnetospirillum sp. XM-1]|uniref:Glu/Leu/Phe/Val dehydrogenase dimerization domain-containing protein n=1 Tax=Magnetospirillum sp. XM-1 TaxID=1663591 RepID=UPI00083954E8|nr:Glu/Leu/Phe/Val dehydrogenase dimerization domain-containing protein [Magnetospirillum sp. XM-1]